MRAALALAVETLSWMEQEGLGERAAFARAANQLQVTETRQLKTAQLLVLETTRRLNFIDHVIESETSELVDLNKLQHGLMSLLRLFCYWTKFHNASDRDIIRILHAARSVLGWKDLHPLELAFGRILSADPAKTDAGLPTDKSLAIRLFHPAWFVSACSFLLGRHSALKLVRRNLSPASTYIRVNTLRGSEEGCLRAIERAGIEAVPVERLPLTYKLISSRRPIVRTEPYRTGRLTIQDKASILAGLVAAPSPGDLILDVCAAPGAKTGHLAQLMENKGTIYSIDRSSARMSSWKREMSRLGVEIAHPLVADASKPLPANLETALVLLDPPCSNTGTFWKTPAAKWTVTQERIHRLAAGQSAMLENVSRFLRIGGTLVYSTCSVLAEENEHVVTRFLSLNPDFRAADSVPRIGLQGLYGLETSQRLYPHVHECNGQFISRIRRIE